MTQGQGTAGSGLEVAVVGMAGRFPGAPSVDALWHNVVEGREAVTFFQDDELDPWFSGRAGRAGAALVKARGVLEGVDLFDAAFFGYSPRDAAVLDPQQRLFLECAWHALEDSGHAPGSAAGAVGVYAGAAMSSYLVHNLLQNRALLASVGNYQVLLATDKDYLATRVAYKLGLEGPAIGVQTACSTSLVAVHLACQGLLAGDCDLALAGGVAITLPQNAAHVYREGGIASPDGHCRPFDAAAQGTVGGSGLGIVVLKRLHDALRDGNTIRALIKGSAVNNDGARKLGFTAPSAMGQARAIAAALSIADVPPETVGYVEGHGTGTPLGDPIEVQALTQAYGSGTAGRCGLGSIKSNLGHLDAAAGVTGLIKAVLAVEQGVVPPTVHYRAPNPALGLEHGPFFVASQPAAWPVAGGPRRAAVSSFGIGGTNAHVVLEQAPERAARPGPDAVQLLVLSARTPDALERLTDALAAHLRNTPHLDLADVAYTLQTGRRAFSVRRVLLCRGISDAADALARREPGRVLDAAPSGPPAALPPDGGVAPGASTADEGGEAFLARVGSFWLAGGAPDWRALHAEPRRLVRLPTYPFERQRHWVEPVDLMEAAPADAPPKPARAAAAPSSDGLEGEPPNEIERALAALWCELLGVEQVRSQDDFFELGGHSLLATQLLARIQELVPVHLPLETIFDVSTLGGLAARVEERLLEAIEGLPESEAQRLAAVLAR